MVKRLGEMSISQLALLVGGILLSIAAAIFAVILVFGAFSIHPVFGIITLLLAIGLPILLVGLFSQ